MIEMVDHSSRWYKARRWFLAHPNAILNSTTFYIDGPDKSINLWICLTKRSGNLFSSEKFTCRGYTPLFTVEEFFDSLVDLLYDISDNQVEITLTRRIDQDKKAHYVIHLSSHLTKAQYDRINDVENPPPPF